jgi:exopolysaccharide biosynthesis predicted pyruvyltransferase EpsI
LLDIADYRRLFEETDTKKNHAELLTYILDGSNTKNEVVNQISNKFNYKIFKTNTDIDNYKLPLSDRIAPSIENWLRGFFDARFVITDSFHACVFSILFNKPFIVIGNKERGMDRFNSLLSMFGLQERLIASVNDLNAATLETEINWNEINNILQDRRKYSESFLIKALA